MRWLNVKITYKCNNKCEYCFSKNDKDKELSIEYLLSMIKKGVLDGCKGLIISGGEPTIDKDKLINIITKSYDFGIEKFIVQTNGHGFDDELIYLLEEYSKKIDIGISFSVLNYTADLHDNATKNKGSFERLMISLERVSKTNCSIYTNTVISKENKNNLDNIIDLIKPFNPEIMQFSVMHTEEDDYISVGLVQSVKAVLNIADMLPKKVLRTEGMPYCMIKGYEECVGESYWPSILDLCNSDKYISDFKQIEANMRWKDISCKECIMTEICHGIWIEQKQEFLSLGDRIIR